MKHSNYLDDQRLARLRQVGQVWNWLPAFRAVAETGHLPTASKRVRVSPSALSRTIGQLEEVLGVSLFRRVGRRIELNDHGEALLDATRDATRRVHDGLLRVHGSHDRGAVRICASGVLARCFLPAALAQLAQTHPGLEPVVDVRGSGAQPGDLTQGGVDVALQSVPTRHPRLETHWLGEVDNGVYCGPGHPLFGVEGLGEADVLEHAFVAPPTIDGRDIDGWPARLERTVRWRVNTMGMGTRLCAQGLALAILPEPVAAEAGLWRLAVADLPTVPLVALRRRQQGPPDRASAVIEAVTSVLGG